MEVISQIECGDLGDEGGYHPLQTLIGELANGGFDLPSACRISLHGDKQVSQRRNGFRGQMGPIFEISWIRGQ